MEFRDLLTEGCGSFFSQGEIIKEHPINTLPPELFEYILSRLDEGSMQTSSRVCKSWNTRTIKAAREQENAMVSQYIPLIVSKIDKKKYPDVSHHLQALLNENSILHSINLIHLKENMDNLKEVIACILMKMDKGDLDQLKKDIAQQTTPHFLNLTDIAKIYHQLENAKETYLEKQKLDPENELKNELNFAKDLLDIAVQLADLGEIVKALETTDIIPISAPYQKSRALLHISYVLASRGITEKGAKILDSSIDSICADKSLSLLSKSLYIRQFSMDLMNLGYFEKAIAVVKKIPKPFEKSCAIQYLIENLLEKKEFDKAIEAALIVPDPRKRFNHLMKIKKICEHNGNHEAGSRACPQITASQ